MGMPKRDVKKQNRNSQNEPGMSFAINETEKRDVKEAVKPAFPSSPRGVKPFTANMLRANRRLHRGWSACIILQLLYLASQLRTNPGKIFRGNQTVIPRTRKPANELKEGSRRARIFSR